MNLKKFLKPRRYLFLGVLALALAESLPLQASPIMIAGSTTANTPSTGNSFDFNLFNSGPGFLSIGGFSLEISVSDTHVTFTSATTATSLPYVFAGHSLFGPTITTSPAGQTMDASDLWDLSGATPTLASGATVGLAHIFFNVSAGAPSGPLTVSVAAFPSSSLSDPLGNNLAAILQNGTITIVPEPPTVVLLMLSVLLLVVRRFRR